MVSEHPFADAEPSFLAVLRRHLPELEAETPIPWDTPLLDLGLDSLGAIDLLLDLEQTFQLVFPDDLLTQETFRNAHALGDALTRLLREQGRA